jgi:hypothetical protein
LFVRETVTRLCPAHECPRPRTSLLKRLDGLFADVRAPYILENLPRSITNAGPDAAPVDQRFARATEAAVPEFEAFLDGLSRDSPADSLHFLHLLLPHHPWRFLPSGHRYGFASSTDWENDEDTLLQTSRQAEQMLQRHLIQLRYTDSLLGRLLGRLQRVGLYDEALVVVVADHGASFERGVPLRRVDRGNLARIARIPLFVKYPGQQHGVVDRRAARTIDILPTIADVLGTPLPWRVDGASLRDAPVRREQVVVGEDSGTSVRGSLRSVERQAAEDVRRSAALFGEGNDSLFRIGAHRQLLGQRVGSARASETVRVRIEDPAKLTHVRKSSGFVPAHISGAVEEGRIADETELAIAVNGRVEALTQCFLGWGEQRFQALVPESALRDGRNRVDVYAVEAGGSRLVHLGGTGS